MKTNHTPGPWKIDGNLIRNTEGQIIAEVQEFHHFEIQLQDGTLDIDSEELPWEANARHFVATLELLDVLQRMTASFTRHNDDDQRLYLEAIKLIDKLNDQ
jgi:hypothetical protein